MKPSTCSIAVWYLFYMAVHLTLRASKGPFLLCVLCLKTYIRDLSFVGNWSSPVSGTSHALINTFHRVWLWGNSIDPVGRPTCLSSRSEPWGKGLYKQLPLFFCVFCSANFSWVCANGRNFPLRGKFKFQLLLLQHFIFKDILNFCTTKWGQFNIHY